MTVMTTHTLAAELVAALRSDDGAILCLGDVPPSPATRSRYLVKKLRAELPDLQIVIGRWAPPELADGDHRLLLDAGSSRVANTLLETRRQLIELSAVQSRTAEGAVAEVG